MTNPQYIPEDPKGQPYSPADASVNGWYVTPDKKLRVHFESGKISFNDGPAILYTNGGEAWLKSGVYHREGDLPAIKICDSYGRIVREAWMVDGKAKRDKKDKPDAIEYQYDSETSKDASMKISTWRNSENLISRKGAPAIVIEDHKGSVVRKEFIDKDYGGYHNANGPAIETLKSKFYYFCNKLHREDGPAVEKKSPSIKEYWLDGRHADKKEVDVLFASGKSLKRDMLKDLQVEKGAAIVPEDAASIEDEIEAKRKARENVAMWAKRSSKRLVA